MILINFNLWRWSCACVGTDNWVKWIYFYIIFSILLFRIFLFISTSKQNVIRLCNEHCLFRPHSLTLISEFLPSLELFFFFSLWRCGPTRSMVSSFLKFLDHTQRLITFGRTPLDEWSARRWDLYLTTHNTHNRQTSMHPVRFELTISAGERL